MAGCGGGGDGGRLGQQLGIGTARHTATISSNTITLGEPTHRGCLAAAIRRGACLLPYAGGWLCQGASHLLSCLPCVCHVVSSSGKVLLQHGPFEGVHVRLRRPPPARPPARPLALQTWLRTTGRPTGGGGTRCRRWAGRRAPHSPGGDACARARAERGRLLCYLRWRTLGCYLGEVRRLCECRFWSWLGEWHRRLGWILQARTDAL